MISSTQWKETIYYSPTQATSEVNLQFPLESVVFNPSPSTTTSMMPCTNIVTAKINGNRSMLGTISHHALVSASPPPVNLCEDSLTLIPGSSSNPSPPPPPPVSSSFRSPPFSAKAATAYRRIPFRRFMYATRVSHNIIPAIITAARMFTVVNTIVRICARRLDS